MDKLYQVPILLFVRMTVHVRQSVFVLPVLPVLLVLLLVPVLLKLSVEIF